MDRFGGEAEIQAEDNGYFRVTVRVSVSQTFSHGYFSLPIISGLLDRLP